MKTNSLGMTNPLNPNRIPPDELAAKLGPFGSWPKDRSLPKGYFNLPFPEAAARFYRLNGFLVLHQALNGVEIEELKSHTARLCRNDDGVIAGISPAGSEVTDVDAMKRVLCIHFPHKLANAFYRALSHPAIVEALVKMIGPNVKCMQSMLFVKASGKPGQAWHQDEDFIPTRDRSLAGAWIALDDATVENGCLWTLPGSQRRGILWPQKFHFDRRFDCTHESYDFPWEDADSIPVEVKAGSIVFFNGYLLHRSLPNQAKTGFRRALVNHYMSAESFLPWMKPDEKTGMAQADYRDIIMVAGRDPFAAKGIADIAKAFVRADGDGGCVDWNDDNERKKAAEHARTVAQHRAVGSY
jgi:phytanoyl-CoA hydroxylase